MARHLPGLALSLPLALLSEALRTPRFQRIGPFQLRLSQMRPLVDQVRCTGESALIDAVVGVVQCSWHIVWACVTSSSFIAQAASQPFHDVIAGIKTEAAPDSNGASVAMVPDTAESEGASAAESKTAEEEGGDKGSEEEEAGPSPPVADNGVESHQVAATRPATAEPVGSRPATAEQVLLQSLTSITCSMVLSGYNTTTV